MLRALAVDYWGVLARPRILRGRKAAQQTPGIGIDTAGGEGAAQRGNLFSRDRPPGHKAIPSAAEHARPRLKPVGNHQQCQYTRLDTAPAHQGSSR